MKNKTVVILLLLCICFMAFPHAAFADCAGFDPCPNGPYGNGDINTDVIGWYQILSEIFNAWFW